MFSFFSSLTSTMVEGHPPHNAFIPWDQGWYSTYLKTVTAWALPNQNWLLWQRRSHHCHLLISYEWIKGPRGGDDGWEVSMAWDLWWKLFAMEIFQYFSVSITLAPPQLNQLSISLLDPHNWAARASSYSVFLCHGKEAPSFTHSSSLEISTSPWFFPLLCIIGDPFSLIVFLNVPITPVELHFIISHLYHTMAYT